MKSVAERLESGNSVEKIKALETLDSAEDPVTLKKIISKLDDDDIRVRGEAFCALILNKNRIADYLVESLGSDSKNIRGFASMVLANRNETRTIPDIIKITKDERSMVRACAIGALGHMRAHEAKGIFLESLFDTNLEVRKSAIQALIHLGTKIPEETANSVTTENDAEIQRLLEKIKK